MLEQIVKPKCLRLLKEDKCPNLVLKRYFFYQKIIDKKCTEQFLPVYKIYAVKSVKTNKPVIFSVTGFCGVVVLLSDPAGTKLEPFIRRFETFK